jgi:predicted metal-dependent HD superfamily phosphohydrolase
MENTPKEIWNKIWIDSGNKTEQINKAWLEIETAYSKKNRYYHNLEHISNMINSSIIFKSKIDDLTTMQLAIFYHDIVYSIKNKDNEEKSSLFAEKSLKQLKFSKELIEKCKHYIIATKKHTNTLNNNDLNYFLDFDLEILSAPWNKYLEYSKEIRKEYYIYPDILYKPGRKKVLQHFLRQDNIYKTKEFRNKFENLARQNLIQELELLQ